MGIWKCSKCGSSTTGINKPLVGVCPRGGGHRWGAVTTNRQSIYRCGKCGNTTTSTAKPVDRPCIKGGKCTWRKYQG